MPEIVYRCYLFITTKEGLYLQTYSTTFPILIFNIIATEMIEKIKGITYIKLQFFLFY